MLCVFVFSASFVENLVCLFISVGRSLPEKGKKDDAYYAENDRHFEHGVPSVCVSKGSKSRPETVVLA